MTYAVHASYSFWLVSVRENAKVGRKEFEKTEDDLKALQSVGQIIGEVLRQLDSERCEYSGALVNCGVQFSNTMTIHEVGCIFF